MDLLECTIVHHTGTIIRFKPSQLSALPSSDLDIDVVLPTGEVAAGHFRRNPANPNVSGRGIVRYIKGRLPAKTTEKMLLEIVSDSWWILYDMKEAVEVAKQAGVDVPRTRSGQLTNQDMRKFVEWADKEAKDDKRIERYRSVLRPSGLRKLVLEFMGTACQVEGCRSTEETREEWGERAALAIVDVHHLEAVAKSHDHSPWNLCVLCANHHRLIHGLAPWEVVHEKDDVILTTHGKSLRIRRDLRGFRSP